MLSEAFLLDGIGLWIGVAAIFLVVAGTWLIAERSRGGRMRALADDHLFINSPLAIVLTDGNERIVDVNTAYERLTGYERGEVLGRALTFNHSDQMDEDSVAAMQAELQKTHRWEGQFWLRNKAGEAFSEKVVRIAVPAVHGISGYITISMDLLGNEDERRLMLWQAHHDTLTKLPNRNLFLERFSRVLMNVSEDSPGALVSIDLDGFKKVNDSTGAASGDQLLTQAAFRIALCARESDTVARIASDHFVMLLERFKDYAELEYMAREVVTKMGEPFYLDERELFITASVGIAVFPQDGTDSGELMQKADAARLQVKKQGGDGVLFFESAMNDRAERRLEIESELRKAIREDQLLLHFQPVIDLRNGNTIGAEALVRWQHPEKGLVSPGEFIPVAEESGLIVDLGEWVIRRVRQHLSDSGDLLDGVRISVNVSAKQIKDRQAIEQLTKVLGEEACNNLTVELTESALIADREGVQLFLENLGELGSRIALDDFGTGFSSLSYLRDFNFDVLKIDKSFIDKLQVTQDYGLVAAIVSMGRILGMQIVAEGVEDDAQVQRLRQIGCDYVQGYFYSRPLPFDEFLEYVRGGSLKDVGGEHLPAVASDSQRLAN